MDSLDNILLYSTMFHVKGLLRELLFYAAIYLIGGWLCGKNDNKENNENEEDIF